MSRFFVITRQNPIRSVSSVLPPLHRTVSSDDFNYLSDFSGGERPGEEERVRQRQRRLSHTQRGNDIITLCPAQRQLQVSRRRGSINGCGWRQVTITRPWRLTLSAGLGGHHVRTHSHQHQRKTRKGMFTPLSFPVLLCILGNTRDPVVQVSFIIRRPSERSAQES